MPRKFFGTDGVRGRANSYPMTADFCLKLGAAAGSYFRRDSNQSHRVVIGKDTRLSGYMFVLKWLRQHWMMLFKLFLGGLMKCRK